MLEVLLLQLDVCLQGMLNHGFCMGWCIVKGIPLVKCLDAQTHFEFSAPRNLHMVDFATPMRAMCQCLQAHARILQLEASLSWACSSRKPKTRQNKQFQKAQKPH